MIRAGGSVSSSTAASALDERDLTAAAERDAATRLAVLQVATEEAMAASGFADATEARAAAMDADDLDRRERLLAEWDAAVRDLAAVLNEPEHDLPEVPPDTEQSDAAAAQARSAEPRSLELSRGVGGAS